MTHTINLLDTYNSSILIAEIDLRACDNVDRDASELILISTCIRDGTMYPTSEQDRTSNTSYEISEKSRMLFNTARAAEDAV